MSTDKLDSVRLLSERVFAKRKLEKITQEALGDLIGISGGYISKIEKQEREPQDWVVKKLQDWLDGVEITPGPDTLDNDSETVTVKIPVYRFAGAGPPQLVEYDPIQFITVEARYAKPSISVIKVRGDSMMPRITPGAFVGVDKADRDVVSGAMYAVWLPYEGAVIKRLFMSPDEVRLKSENPEHDDIRLPASSVEDHLILGRVRWVLQEYEG